MILGDDIYMYCFAYLSNCLGEHAVLRACARERRDVRIVSFATLLPAPASITFANVTDIAANLTWSTVANATSYNLQYKKTSDEVARRTRT
jgi:hypothetical protein